MSRLTRIAAIVSAVLVVLAGGLTLAVRSQIEPEKLKAMHIQSSSMGRVTIKGCTLLATHWSAHNSPQATQTTQPSGPNTPWPQSNPKSKFIKSLLPIAHVSITSHTWCKAYFEGGCGD